MRSQIVCNGCKSLLLYPADATNVRCAVCQTITPVQPTDQIICRGCRTLLMYARGATSVSCLCCSALNLISPPVATISCASCHIALMYPIGASSVKCAVCQYITPVGAANLVAPIPGYRPNGAATPSVPSSSAPSSNSQTQTVVVENPMSVDESGKLVSNVVVGVTTGKK
ncbi:hypothetical protein Droror1_Dr00003562 [Drosera rotundifolia]